MQEPLVRVCPALQVWQPLDYPLMHVSQLWWQSEQLLNPVLYYPSVQGLVAGTQVPPVWAIILSSHAVQVSMEPVQFLQPYLHSTQVSPTSAVPKTHSARQIPPMRTLGETHAVQVPKDVHAEHVEVQFMH